MLGFIPLAIELQVAEVRGLRLLVQASETEK